MCYYVSDLTWCNLYKHCGYKRNGIEPGLICLVRVHHPYLCSKLSNVEFILLNENVLYLT
ncbi:hypothetical protein Hanom_Chr03g00247951 [Helianthus anomalus]